MSPVKALLWQANGHQGRVADGTLVPVYWDEHLEPFSPQPGPRCYTCDAELTLQITNDTARVTEPCPYPDGITTTVTLNVPSGKLLVSDDLRPVYDWDDAGLASYNCALGQAQVTRVMAAAGCAFGFTGNTCPGLYRTGEDRYVIASPGYDQDDDEEELPPGWTLLAGLITDLWAYALADYEHWRSRGGDPDSLDGGDTVTDVTPGSYRVTSHGGERGFDTHATGTVIFAHIGQISAETEKQ